MEVNEGASNAKADEELASSKMKVDEEANRLASFSDLATGNGEQLRLSTVNYHDKILMDKKSSSEEQLTPNGVGSNLR